MVDALDIVLENNTKRLVLIGARRLTLHLEFPSSGNTRLHVCLLKLFVCPEVKDVFQL